VGLVSLRHLHNFPSRTRAKASGKGVFENVKISQTSQMAKTGGEDTSGVNAEE